MKISTGLADTVLSSAPLRTALNGGEIRLYSGAMPASADEAIGGATLIGTYKAAGANPLNFESSSVAGVLSKASSEVWSGTTVAAGTATWFRHVLPADDGTASSTAPRIQGTYGLVGTDIVAASNNYTSGVSLRPLESYNIRMPLA